MDSIVGQQNWCPGRLRRSAHGTGEGAPVNIDQEPFGTGFASDIWTAH